MEKKIELRLEQLVLDPNNYRIQTDERYVPVEPGTECNSGVQKRTFSIITGNRQEEIKDLLDSFQSNGYLPVDQIQVRKIDEEHYLVLEGNRRVATLKWMCQEYREHGYSLGKLEPLVFEHIPVVVNDETDIQFHVLMGLKHISGNKKWGLFNQALLLYDMKVKAKLAEGDICSKLGIARMTFRQKYRAVCLVKQYQSSDYGDQFDESMFPMFMEIARQPELKVWLGWNEDLQKAENTKNVEILFSLMSKIEDEEADNNDGDDTRFQTLEPAITKRDEIRHFAEFINETQTIEKLCRHRDFQSAYANSSVVRKEQCRQSVDELKAAIDALRSFRFEGLERLDLETCHENLAEIVDANFGALERQNLQTIGKSGYCHLHNLIIEKYKCFRGLTSFTDFSRINIIAGNNNAGKTSLLEAIYLLVRQNNVFAFRDIMNIRGKITDSHTNYGWLYQQVSDIALSGETNDGKCSYSLSVNNDDVFSADSSDCYLGTLNISTSFLDIPQVTNTRFFKERIENPASGYSLGTIVFHSPFCFNEEFRYRKFYEKSKDVKQHRRIVEFLKTTIDPTIEDIYWQEESRRFRIQNSTQPEAFDLCQMGEGFQRMYLVALIFASAANGVVLIDEFENAVHAGMLENFAQLIYDLSQKFNVQVFITSHSKECIDSFAKLVQQKQEKDDFAFFGLAAKDTERVVKRFSGKDYWELLDFADVDLRRVRI